MYALNGNKIHERLVSLMVTRAACFVRRCRGVVVRSLVGGIYIPRHLGSFAVLGFLSASAAYGVYAGGHVSETVKVLTSTFGFAVDKVNVSGNIHTSEIDVLGALGLDGETSMIGFDVDAARDILAQLPWVQSVSVQKVYPNQLNIAIVERQPLAIWQHGEELDVIDKDGQVIAPFHVGLGHSLPFVVGKGAETQAASFLKQMNRFASFNDRIRAYIRVGDRRWDIMLDNGMRVKLPEQDYEQRLADALEIDKQDKLFSRDVMSVDLRLSDRITVALSDDAMARRTAAIKEMERQEKARKAGRV